MTPEKRVGSLILAAAALAVLLVAAIVVAHQGRGLNYAILFNDAKGLQRGDTVQLGGVAVGAVRSVELISANPSRVRVGVRIVPEHAENVQADSTAYIEPVAIPNVSGQKVVAIYNPSGSTAPPMAEGEQVEGLNTVVELQTWKLQDRFSGAAESVGDRVGRVTESIVEGGTTVTRTLRDRGGQSVDALREKSAQWTERLRDAGERATRRATSPEARELAGQAVDRVQDFVDLMLEKGAGAADELAERWQEVRGEMGPVLERLAELGRDYIVDLVRQVMGEIEDTVNRLRGLTSPGPTLSRPPPDESP